MSDIKNLTQYGDNELSNWVMNDEGLYNLIYSVDVLRAAIDELFEYTDFQWNTLLTDINDFLQGK